MNDWFDRLMGRILKIYLRFKELFSKNDIPAEEAEPDVERREYVPVAHRRSYQRFVADTKATLILGGDSREPLVLRDVSARGAGVASNMPLMVNLNVGIIMNLPKFFKQPVYRNAKVVWCRQMGNGQWQAGLDFGLDNIMNLAY